MAVVRGLLTVWRHKFAAAAGKLVEGVSQRMLTLTLKSLERDGLVTRTVYPTNPATGGL
jgi:DNA-binding HxlR family transcriptional regulator